MYNDFITEIRSDNIRFNIMPFFTAGKLIRVSFQDPAKKSYIQFSDSNISGKDNFGFIFLVG